jgi:hypothetical protein
MQTFTATEMNELGGRVLAAMARENMYSVEDSFSYVHEELQRARSLAYDYYAAAA